MKIHYYKNIRLGNGAKLTLSNHGVGYSVSANRNKRNSAFPDLFSDFGVFFARERRPKQRIARSSGGGLLSTFFTLYATVFAWIICFILLCCKWAVKLTVLFFILMARVTWQLLKWSCIGIAWGAEKLLFEIKQLYRYLRDQYELHKKSQQ